MSALARIADAHRLARLTRHGELIAQRAAPTVTIGRARVALPPGAFLQATAAGEAALARLVDGHIGSAKTVADLFCGVGPFALRLAERARVARLRRRCGGDRGAQAGGRHDAGAEADRGRGARPVPPAAGGRRSSSAFDAVVFDPPRQGAEAQARELAKSAVAGGRRGVVQSGDVRARRPHPGRWRLPAHGGHAGRSVPPFGACRDRGAASASA